MNTPLQKSFEFYLDNQKELVKKFNGKFIVIKGEKVIGAYDDEVAAINETCKKHALGTFLVQYVEPGADSYTQTFHSRVAFA